MRIEWFYGTPETRKPRPRRSQQRPYRVGWLLPYINRQAMYRRPPEVEEILGIYIYSPKPRGAPKPRRPAVPAPVWESRQPPPGDDVPPPGEGWRPPPGELPPEEPPPEDPPPEPPPEGPPPPRWPEPEPIGFPSPSARRLRGRRRRFDPLDLLF